MYFFLYRPVLLLYNVAVDINRRGRCRQRRWNKFQRGGASMAVPKRKHSQARRDKRRSNVWKLQAPTLVTCTQCGSFTVPHKACGICGYYKGREVVKLKEA
jgi:large subunit ribosomal protein L32